MSQRVGASADALYPNVCRSGAGGGHRGFGQDSPAASRTMREIFASPDIPHDDHKFVKALAGRDREILRKWGSWQEWLHDSAVVTGEGRHYILVGLTHHPKGDEYLVDLARGVDDLMDDER